jgi:flagellar protein FlgJ
MADSPLTGPKAMPAATAPVATSLATPRASGSPQAMRKAAQDFEAQMLGALLQPMFAGLSSKGLFKGGQAEEQWQPMLIQEFGRAMARAGGVGIADSVLREMQRLQAQAKEEGR